MATHKRKTKLESEVANPNRVFEFKGFINVELSEEDKSNLASMDIETEFPFGEGILECLADGYKVALSYDHKNNCCTATITDVDGSRAAYGYALTGRGKTYPKAWAALAYRHYYIFRDGWLIKPQQKEAQDFF